MTKGLWSSHQKAHDQTDVCSPYMICRYGTTAFEGNSSLAGKHMKSDPATGIWEIRNFRRWSVDSL